MRTATLSILLARQVLSHSLRLVVQRHVRGVDAPCFESRLSTAFPGSEQHGSLAMPLSRSDSGFLIERTAA
jgi:hypothetical protein